MTKDEFDKCLVAAERGDAGAQYLLGKHYEQAHRLGFDSPRIEGNDSDVHWYHQAAGQGHQEAQYTLGMYYLRGIGVEKNAKLANDWFAKAAEQGHEKAIRRLS